MTPAPYIRPAPVALRPVDLIYAKPGTEAGDVQVGEWLLRVYQFQRGRAA